MPLALEPALVVADRYRLDRQLGQGGMGTVWAATNLETGAQVAIKLIRDPARERPELRWRFMREARAAAGVQHPNVVQILDSFELDADTPVMVMELLEGETLGARLSRDRKLSLEETARLLLPAISAVGTAHSLGIVHRDLKPDNIYLSRTANGVVVKILDFGIAKLSDSMIVDSFSGTRTGATLGTPFYMAPEQAAADANVDHRVDIWAFGVILYECLSGVRPIEGNNVPEVVMHLMNTGIVPLARMTRGIPEEVTVVIDRMLMRERSRRPQDLQEVARVISERSGVAFRAFEPAALRAPRMSQRVSRISRLYTVLCVVAATAVLAALAIWHLFWHGR